MQGWADKVPPEYREEFEERAAIMEHEAGMTRKEAERRAAMRILQREGLQWIGAGDSMLTSPDK